MPLQLLDLPHEVLNAILRYIHPADLGALSCSCRSFRDYISANALLHKEIYLHHFDKSRFLDDNPGPHWAQRLHRFVKLFKLLESQDIEVKRDNFQFITDTICELLKHSVEALPEQKSHNITLLKKSFGEDNLKELLCQSTLFARARDRQSLYLRSRDTIAHSSAKLHSLYGVPVESDPESCPGDTELVETYPYAISKVYDLRNYTSGTLWGPFLDDSSQNVDWEMIEAIMIVLGHNIKASREYLECCRNIWVDPFSGAVPHSHVSRDPPHLITHISSRMNRQQTAPTDFVDPYNVTGTWMRAVCFLDYRDLFDYNWGLRGSQTIPRGQPLRPYPTEEATRLILMQFRAVGYEEHEDDDDKDWPVVKFVGVTVPVHASWDSNAHASMTGTVRMTREGELRWTTFSIYGGEKRWRSEGIQVGGINSARGVIGTWFDKDYDPHGPAGPTAFWKISDGEQMGKEGEASEDEFPGIPIFGIIIQT